MVCVPELGHDEEVFSLDDTTVYALSDGLSDLLFVAVERRAIDESVTFLDGNLDGFVDLLVVLEGVEGTKADRRDLLVLDHGVDGRLGIRLAHGGGFV